VKFCSRTSQLPASLFIHGVNIGDVRDPCSTGGFADIYRGKYRQMEVAVKKLRFLIADDRAAVHKVGLCSTFCRFDDIPADAQTSLFARRRLCGSSSTTPMC
jgi:hypothetical protein